MMSEAGDVDPDTEDNKDSDQLEMSANASLPRDNRRSGEFVLRDGIDGPAWACSKEGKKSSSSTVFNGASLPGDRYAGGGEEVPDVLSAA